VVLRGSSGGPPGLCGFSPVVDLRMVFLCLVLGSCGVSGISVVFLESVFGELLHVVPVFGPVWRFVFCDETCSCYVCVLFL